jgi:hypothetical protein
LDLDKEQVFFFHCEVEQLLLSTVCGWETKRLQFQEIANKKRPENKENQDIRGRGKKTGNTK